MVSMIVGPGPRAPSSTWAAARWRLGMVGMMLGQIGRGKGERKHKLNGARRDYLRYLAQVRRTGTAGRQRAARGAGVGQPDPAVAVVGA